MLYEVITADEAMKQAGLDLEKLNLDKAGVIFGSGIGGFNTFYEEMKGFLQNNEVPRFNPFFIPKMILDIAAGQISMKYGFRGPNRITSYNVCYTKLLRFPFELSLFSWPDW